MPSTLRAAPLKIGAPISTKANAPPVREEPAWRKWYKTARWQKLRITILVRDNYRCAKCGRICDGRYPDDDSPVADHKIAHRGDPVLFWNPDNLQTLCKFPCHDSQKQAEEAMTLKYQGVWD